MAQINKKKGENVSLICRAKLIVNYAWKQKSRKEMEENPHKKTHL